MFDGMSQPRRSYCACVTTHALTGSGCLSGCGRVSTPRLRAIVSAWRFTWPGALLDRWMTSASWTSPSCSVSQTWRSCRTCYMMHSRMRPVQHSEHTPEVLHAPSLMCATDSGATVAATCLCRTPPPCRVLSQGASGWRLKTTAWHSVKSTCRTSASPTVLPSTPARCKSSPAETVSTAIHNYRISVALPGLQYLRGYKGWLSSVQSNYRNRSTRYRD